MKKVIKSSAALLCIGAMAACTSKSSVNGTKTVDTSSIASANLTPSEKADKFALAGEQLTTPTGFMYADMVFDQALTFEPNNKKAQFYKAFLAQPMALKGALARIKPYAYQNPKSKQQYDDTVAHLPNSGVKTFLLDGKPDIKTEKDVQAFADSLYQAQDTFRKFLKANKNLDLTLNLNDWAIPSAYQKAIEQCGTSEVQDGVFQVEQCDYSHSFEVKLNRADIEALQQITAGLEIYTSFATAYDASGAISVANKYQNQDQVPASVIWKDLIKTSDFGNLRSQNQFRAISAMGLDAIAGVRWAVQIQNQLCPKGQDAENRPGYLFEKGICINSVNDDGSKLEGTLKLIELGLSGQVIEVAGQDGQQSVQLNPSAFLKNPIKDLKALNPAFNDCGVVSIADNTLGGIFPKGDFNQYLAQNSQDCSPTPVQNK